MTLGPTLQMPENVCKPGKPMRIHPNSAQGHLMWTPSSHNKEDLLFLCSPTFEVWYWAAAKEALPLLCHLWCSRSRSGPLWNFIKTKEKIVLFQNLVEHKDLTTWSSTGLSLSVQWYILAVYNITFVFVFSFVFIKAVSLVNVSSAPSEFLFKTKATTTVEWVLLVRVFLF